MICEERGIVAWIWTNIEHVIEMVISVPPSIHWDSVSGSWAKLSSQLQKKW